VTSIQQVGAIGVSIVTLTTAFVAIVRWLVKHYFRDALDDLKATRSTVQELKPNGGSSVADKINRLEVDTKETKGLVYKLEGRVDEIYQLLITRN
jgi:hypothetical protein